jgi:class 3 adenylate cyclase
MDGVVITTVRLLLDRAVAAINRGDRAAATVLVGQVLAADSANAEAEDLLAAPSDPGEIRRLTIFFADLVDSTALSTRVEPETYRLLVGRYREQVLHVVKRYEGHIGSTKGDGLLTVFGHPIAHEDAPRSPRPWPTGSCSRPFPRWRGRSRTSATGPGGTRSNHSSTAGRYRTQTCLTTAAT